LSGGGGFGGDSSFGGRIDSKPHAAEPASTTHKIKLEYKDFKIDAESPASWLIVLVLVLAAVAVVVLIGSGVKAVKEKTSGSIALLLSTGIVGGLLLFAGGTLVGRWWQAGICRTSTNVKLEKEVDRATFDSQVRASVESEVQRELVDARTRLAEASTELRIVQEGRNRNVWAENLTFAAAGLFAGLAFGSFALVSIRTSEIRRSNSIDSELVRELMSQYQRLVADLVVRRSRGRPEAPDSSSERR